VWIRGFSGCILCQKRLRLSRKVDECKPLVQKGITVRGFVNPKAIHTRPCVEVSWSSPKSLSPPSVLDRHDIEGEDDNTNDEDSSPEGVGRGLHASTSQLNLSRVCHKKTPYTRLNTPLTRATQPLRAPPIPNKTLKLS